MAEEITRLYTAIGDADMLTEADTMQTLFVEDQAVFEAFDASLNDTFADDFKDLIDAARAFPTDEAVQDVIAGLTTAMNTAWGACKLHFQDAKYFIEKAFKDDTAKQNEFGFDDYRDMARLQNKVITFMQQYHATCSVAANKTKLIDAGYTQDNIDQILILSEAFRDAQLAQDSAIKKRPVITQQRIETMNGVWGCVQKVNRASKNVFRTNYAKLQEYLLPAAGSNEEGLSAKGKITQDGAPKAGAIVALTAFGLTSTSDDEGNYGFAGGLAEGATPIKVIGDDIVTIDDSITLIEGETVVKNFAVTGT